MAIPVWTTGEVLEASDVNTWFVPGAALKTSNQSVTSSVVLANDSQLFLPMATAATYDLDLKVFYDGGTNGSSDMIIGLTVPASTTGLLRIAGINLSLAFQYGYRTIPISAWANGTNGPSNVFVMEIAGTITTTTSSGNLQFQFAQNVSNSTATTVLAGSTMILQRIS